MLIGRCCNLLSEWKTHSTLFCKRLAFNVQQVAKTFNMLNVLFQHGMMRCSRFVLAFLVYFNSKNIIFCFVCFRIVSSFILEGKGLRTTGSSSEPLWSMEKMQAYFCYIKTLKPQLTPQSNRSVIVGRDQNIT